MEIRILQPEEYLEGMLVAHGVFDYCLKQNITDRQLIEGFDAYAEETAIRKLAEEGRVTLWGVFDENRMVGVSALQSEGHITLIYVYSAFQRRGYGSRLLTEMRRYAAEKYGHRTVTLNALPSWTADFFVKHGFHRMELAPGTQLPFVPLQAKTIGSYRTYEKKPIPSGVVVGTSIAGLVLCFLVAFGFMAFYLW